MSIVESRVYCTKCKNVIDPKEEAIGRNEQIHKSCKEAFENYVQPSTCMFCQDILDSPGICPLCKLGNYKNGGWMYRLITLENGEIKFVRNYYREPTFTHMYYSIDEYKDCKIKNFISRRVKKTWQISTLYLGKNKGYGLKKREYLQKKYTNLCKCKICKPRKSNKGEKKENYRFMKFYMKNQEFP